MKHGTENLKYAVAMLAAFFAAALLFSDRVQADPGDVTGIYKGGLVAATTTPASTTITGVKLAAIYFENLDDTDTVVIAFGGATAAYAGNSTDYTNQLVLGPGDAVSLELFGERTFSVDASGNANLVWRATGFRS